jgi:hypothetical protein
MHGTILPQGEAALPLGDIVIARTQHEDGHIIVRSTSTAGMDIVTVRTSPPDHKDEVLVPRHHPGKGQREGGTGSLLPPKTPGADLPARCSYARAGRPSNENTTWASATLLLTTSNQYQKGSCLNQTWGGRKESFVG